MKAVFVDAISKTYPGGKQALKGVTLGLWIRVRSLAFWDPMEREKPPLSSF